MRAYLVAKGIYADYEPLHVFADHDTAQWWALTYNSTHPRQCDGDEARVEEIGFTAAGMAAPPVDGPVVIDGTGRALNCAGDSDA
ncbi:hypothetical protein ACWDKQ_34570 [Saccharopolyspora sp. NPDC000995]